MTFQATYAVAHKEKPNDFLILVFDNVQTWHEAASKASKNETAGRTLIALRRAS